MRITGCARLAMAASAAVLIGGQAAGAESSSLDTGHAGGVAGLPLPACDKVRRAPPADPGDVFDTRYPTVLMGAASVERVRLSAGQIDNVVQYLVCFAQLTNRDPVVVEDGLALFASKRQGAVARASLAAMARGEGPHASAARQFDEQVRAYLKSPAGR